MSLNTVSNGLGLLKICVGFVYAYVQILFASSRSTRAAADNQGRVIEPGASPLDEVALPPHPLQLPDPEAVHRRGESEAPEEEVVLLLATNAVPPLTSSSAVYAGGRGSRRHREFYNEESPTALNSNELT